MGHSWPVWQWSAYTIANWISAAGFFWISYRIYISKTPTDSIDYLARVRTRFLLFWFINVCAWHHFTHPFLMYFDQPLLIIAVDSALAAVVAYSAYRFELDD